MKSKTKLFKKIDGKDLVLNGSIPFLKLIFIFVAINLSLIALVFLLKDRLPPEIPLFYGMPWGENQLAPQYLLSLPCALSITILLLNSIIVSIIEDVYWKKVLIVSAFAISILSIITTVKIALLVGNF